MVITHFDGGEIKVVWNVRFQMCNLTGNCEWNYQISSLWNKICRRADKFRASLFRQRGCMFRKHCMILPKDYAICPVEILLDHCIVPSVAYFLKNLRLLYLSRLSCILTEEAVDRLTISFSSAAKEIIISFVLLVSETLKCFNEFESDCFQKWFRTKNSGFKLISTIINPDKPAISAALTCSSNEQNPRSMIAIEFVKFPW